MTERDYRYGHWRNCVAKQDDSKDPIEKARRKLARAQLRFNAAQERHAEARIHGKQEIERARLRAAKWQAKAAERVERRAERVARSEAKLLSLTSQVDVIEFAAAQTVSSSDGIAADLEALAEALENERGTIIIPEGVRESRPSGRRRQKPVEDVEAS
jgi:hypothetical protein